MHHNKWSELQPSHLPLTDIKHKGLGSPLTSMHIFTKFLLKQLKFFSFTCLVRARDSRHIIGRGSQDNYWKLSETKLNQSIAQTERKETKSLIHNYNQVMVTA